jgi:hypothetical protein
MHFATLVLSFATLRDFTNRFFELALFPHLGDLHSAVPAQRGTGQPNAINDLWKAPLGMHSHSISGRQMH